MMNRLNCIYQDINDMRMKPHSKGVKHKSSLSEVLWWCHSCQCTHLHISNTKLPDQSRKDLWRQWRQAQKPLHGLIKSAPTSESENGGLLYSHLYCNYCSYLNKRCLHTLWHSLCWKARPLMRCYHSDITWIS